MSTVVVPRAKAKPAGVASRRRGPAAGEPEVVGPSRRANILLAAQELFANNGFNGVSMRDIAEQAGVPVALVSYHFGSKVELYRQIYWEREGYVGERLEALSQAQREARPEQLLEAIVSAFVLPALRLATTPQGRTFLRLLARGMTEQLAEDSPIIREMFDPLAHAFITAIHAATPGTSRGTAAWCYQFALGALLHHVIDVRVGPLSLGENQPQDEVVAGPLLVRFITEGIRGVYARDT